MRKSKSLPRQVAIVGAGMSKFGAFPEKTAGICLSKHFRKCDYRLIEALTLSKLWLFACRTSQATYLSARITGFDPLRPGEIRVGSPVQVDFN